MHHTQLVRPWYVSLWHVRMIKLVLLGSCWVAASLGCPPASLPGSSVTPQGQ